MKFYLNTSVLAGKPQGPFEQPPVTGCPGNSAPAKTLEFQYCCHWEPLEALRNVVICFSRNRPRSILTVCRLR